MGSWREVPATKLVYKQLRYDKLVLVWAGPSGPSGPEFGPVSVALSE